MYKIIGGDQKEYGPVSAEQLRQWIAEGRVNGQTSTQSEGTSEWKPLSAFPELADLEAVKPVSPGAPPAYAAPPGVGEDFLARDYDLDIGRCVGDSWKLLQGNFGMICGGVAVFLLVQIGMSGLAQIPLLGILVSVASLIVSGPLTGGVYYFLLKNIRRQPAEIGDVFAGFRLALGQLLLGYLVVVLLTALAALPGIVIMAIPIMMMVHHHAVTAGQILVAMLGFIVLLVPAIYLSTSWIFALPLIIDKQMEFWPAMRASWKTVGKHWWLVFGLVVVCGLINIAGILVCCVGIFVSLPIALGAMMYAYESIFSAPASQTS